MQDHTAPSSSHPQRIVPVDEAGQAAAPCPGRPPGRVDGTSLRDQWFGGRSEEGVQKKRWSRVTGQMRTSTFPTMSERGIGPQ